MPLASFMLARGRCRYCGGRIAPAYPLIELAAAGIGIGPTLVLTPLAALVAAALGWWLLGLALVDLRTFRLPDAMTLPLLVVGLVLAWLQPLGVPMPVLGDAVLAAAGGGLVLTAIALGYRALRGREGLGLGDAKLCAAAGAWLGIDAMPWLVLLAALMGLALALLLHRRLQAQAAIPFGPPLALAFWLLWMAP